MPESALLNTAGPTALPIGDYPSTSAWRNIQPKMRPSVAVGRMLQYSAIGTHSGKGSSKATGIVAELPAHFS